MRSSKGNESTSHTSLTLHLELRSGSLRPAGTVVLVNTGSTDIRVWQCGNQWGDTVLSFEILRGEGIWRVVRKPQDYTRNVPSSVEVLVGARHEWPFDLGDGDWDADAPIEQLAVAGAQLVAVYNVPRSSEAVDHGVWTGQLRSEPVLLSESGLHGQN